MSAEFWAILGVGVALGGLHWRVYARLDARIDAIDRRMNERIDVLGQRMNKRFDAVDQRVNDLDRRLARIEGWIAGRFREDVSA